MMVLKLHTNSCLSLHLKGLFFFVFLYFVIFYDRFPFCVFLFPLVALIPVWIIPSSPYNGLPIYAVFPWGRTQSHCCNVVVYVCRFIVVTSYRSEFTSLAECV